MTKGFFTIAQGDTYLRAAYGLGLSLKLSQAYHSALTIGITPDSKVPAKYLEVMDVVEIPWTDHAANSEWKLENEWKAIYMTPYDHTIKLDADMLFLEDITPWWNLLDQSEGVFATQVLDYRNQHAKSMFYRRVWVDNDLPNIYTAFFSFKKTEAVYELFKLAEQIYYNWQRYYQEYLEPNTRPTYVSTDLVFAIAAKILGFTEHNKNPHIPLPTFVHMKTQLQEWETNVKEEDWTQLIPQYFTPDCELKIGNYRQTSPFHYHKKHFLTDEMISYMERKLGI